LQALLRYDLVKTTILDHHHRPTHRSLQKSITCSRSGTTHG